MIIRILDLRPPRIAQLFVLIATGLHLATPLDRFDIYSNVILGTILGIGGFAIMMWGWWLFKIFDTAICPTAKTDHLVTSGIYKLTRNPMYLGMIFMLLALALLVGTFPFYFAAIVYFTVINKFFCPYEENKLTESFGETYLSYKNKVRRWL